MANKPWTSTPSSIRQKQERSSGGWVELIDTNSSYAIVKHQDGRESTVSLRDLAPCPVFEAENTGVIKEPLDVLSLLIERTDCIENEDTNINEQLSAELDARTPSLTKADCLGKTSQASGLVTK